MTRLAELAWPEVPSGAIVAVPLGATEQHGPHLPIGTDTEIATRLCDALAGARPGVLVAPAVALGASGEHEGFPGTLSIGREATELLLVELGRSASAWAARLLVVSAHGGNEVPLRRACARLAGEGRVVAAWSPRWSVAGLAPPDAHAGRLETSVVSALEPGAVREEAVVAGNRTPLGELMPDLVAEGVRAASPTGVLGDPTGWSSSEGRAYLAGAVADLCAFVDAWLEGAA